MQSFLTPPKENIEAPMTIKIIGLIALLVSPFVFLAEFSTIILAPLTVGSYAPPIYSYISALCIGFFISSIGIRKMERWAFYLGAASILGTLWVTHTYGPENFIWYGILFGIFIVFPISFSLYRRSKQAPTGRLFRS